MGFSTFLLCLQAVVPFILNSQGRAEIILWESTIYFNWICLLNLYESVAVQPIQREEKLMLSINLSADIDLSNLRHITYWGSGFRLFLTARTVRRCLFFSVTLFIVSEQPIYILWGCQCIPVYWYTRTKTKDCKPEHQDRTRNMLKYSLSHSTLYLRFNSAVTI